MIVVRLLVVAFAAALVLLARALAWLAGFVFGLCRQPPDRAREAAQRGASGAIVSLAGQRAQHRRAGEQVAQAHRPTLRVVPGSREGVREEELLR